MKSKSKKIEYLRNKLQILEEKYYNLFQESPFAIVLLNQRGDIIECNHYTKKMFGYNRKELIGKNYLKLAVYSSEMRPQIKEIFENLIEGKYYKPTEFQIKKKDGKIVNVLAFISIVKSKHQTIIQTLVLDISERKQYEDTIKRKLQIEKLTSTISSKLVGDSEIDSALYNSLKEIGNLYSADRAYILLNNDEDVLDFFVQVSCTNNSDVELIKLESVDFNKFLWSKEEYNEKGYIFVPNSDNLPLKAEKTKALLEYLDIFSLLIYPLIINNKLKGFLALDRLNYSLDWNESDLITLQTCSEIISNALDRKWSNETLKSSNQLLAGILSSLTEIIALIDQNLNIIWMNNVAKAKFESNFENRCCYDIFLNRTEPCENCIALKTFSDGKIHETEMNLVDIENNQIICWATSTSAALDYRGETELSLIILRDITHKKETENKLKILNQNLIQKVEERTLQLKRSEENYKRMLNELDVGFYRGEYQGKLLKHNIAFNLIFGIDPTDSLVGTKASQFFINKDAQKYYYDTLIQNGNIQNFIVYIRSPNGEVIKVQLNSHLIRDSNGEPSIVEGTVIKVSD